MGLELGILMSIQGFRGQEFTTQVLFVDRELQPNEVVDPWVQIFYICPTTAQKVVIVEHGVLIVLDPAAECRWIHVWDVPEDIPVGTLIHSEVRAMDAKEGVNILLELDPVVVVPYNFLMVLDTAFYSVVGMFKDALEMYRRVITDVKSIQSNV